MNLSIDLHEHTTMDGVPTVDIVVTSDGSDSGSMSVEDAWRRTSSIVRYYYTEHDGIFIFDEHGPVSISSAFGTDWSEICGRERYTDLSLEMWREEWQAIGAELTTPGVIEDSRVLIQILT